MAKQEPNQALLDALRNPLRRSLLRRYVESAEMLSPKELASLEKKSLSGVSYHVRVLAKCGAIEEAGDRRVRGSIEHFYLPTDLVKETPWVLATLGLEG
ncbi:MAG: winged helix-turn-helix domain-containing protein [Solirubrobacterales bacterium]